MALLLHHNTLGYVAHCPCSGQLHVCFGTVALTTTPAEFADLRTYVGLMASYQARIATPSDDPTERRIALRTSAERLALVLSRAELSALENLLDTTALLLEARALVGLA